MIEVVKGRQMIGRGNDCAQVDLLRRINFSLFFCGYMQTILVFL